VVSLVVAPFLSQLNLVLQMIILVLLWLSYLLKRRGRFFLHGSFVSTAVVLNAVAFLLVMGPSLISLTVDQFASLSLWASAVVLVHAVLGSVVLVLGIWIVGSWRFRSGTVYCAGKKRVMLPTIVAWTIAAALGVYLYLLLYF
jgi:uncharacterized membrane protein YozB (DUF420 family)